MISPAFQFYPGEWLKSAKVACMNPAEECGYHRLLCYDWTNDGLEDDDQSLAKLSRLGEEWFKGSSRVVRACFIPHPTKPGFITNRRLEEEREKQRAWREKCRAGGVASSNVRVNARKCGQNQGNEGGEGLFKGSSRVVELNPNSVSLSLSVQKEKYIKESSLPGIPDPEPAPDPKQEFKTWVNKLFRRRSTTPWDEKEEAELTKVWKRKPTAEDIALMEAYYTPYGQPYRRTSIERFLRHWNGELDQAIAEKEGVRKPAHNGPSPHTNGNIPPWKVLQILDEEIASLAALTESERTEETMALLKTKRAQRAALKGAAV